MSDQDEIRIVGARQHNLKNVSVVIPHESLTVITGLSGSGKSSLAFDTLYAEGERRYVESLSPQSRQFLDQMPKPDVDRIDGLTPVVAIQQRIASSNPRSTVATTTEIHDYLRILFATVGVPRCWECGRPIERQSVSKIVDAIASRPEGTKVMILAPLSATRPADIKIVLEDMTRQGFMRVRIDGTVFPIESAPPMSSHDRWRLELVVDRLVLKPGVASRLADSVELALRVGDGRVEARFISKDGSENEDVFSGVYACVEHPYVRLAELSQRLFSFNSPHGACPTCTGLGTVLDFDEDLIVPNRDLSLAEGAIAPWRAATKGAGRAVATMLERFCQDFSLPPDTPFRNIKPDLARVLMRGTSKQQERTIGASFEGVVSVLRARWAGTDSENLKQRLHQCLSEAPCAECGGGRLRKEATAVTVGDTTLPRLCDRNIAEARRFFDELSFTGESALVADQPLRQIRARLRFLEDVGLDYLTLSRGSATLSGGEAQRIRLATQIGSGLVGLCYVLDEPTVGLHQRDSRCLLETVRRLTDAGNTMVVVEHDEEVIGEADHVIDIGPGAGAHGGEVVFEGSVDELMSSPRSSTGRYLSGRDHLPVPTQRRKTDAGKVLEIRGAAENNLKNLDVRFPLGRFVCVTGVSGSGKSTLVSRILLRAMQRRLTGGGPRPGRHAGIVGASHVDKVIEIDQAPIGRSPRSNPATYVGVFDWIRRLFTKTREARIRGYGPGRFSFNVKGGRCEECQGQGTKRIEMHFLPDVFVECDACCGARYNRETLDIRYRGRNIADVLDMSVEEAVTFFENFKRIHDLLVALDNVGLGYVKLGQSSLTLSGGEAQRIKLAAELGKPASSHTLYVLDEPTTGLHFEDIRRLVEVLNRLVDKGHSVIVIEHNLEVVKMADWIIDLGPAGGDRGGLVVAEGTPEDIAAAKASHTGRYLKARLHGGPLLDRVSAIRPAERVAERP